MGGGGAQQRKEQKREKEKCTQRWGGQREMSRHENIKDEMKWGLNRKKTEGKVGVGRWGMGGGGLRALINALTARQLSVKTRTAVSTRLQQTAEPATSAAARLSCCRMQVNTLYNRGRETLRERRAAQLNTPLWSFHLWQIKHWWLTWNAVPEALGTPHPPLSETLRCREGRWRALHLEKQQHPCVRNTQKHDGVGRRTNRKMSCSETRWRWNSLLMCCESDLF